jgi:hypothetical protein
LILGLTVPSTQQRAQRYPQEQEWPAFQQSFSRDIACYRLDNKAKGYKDGDKVRSEDPVRYQLVECHGEWLFVESLVRIKDRCAERPVIAQVEGDWHVAGSVGSIVADCITWSRSAAFAAQLDLFKDVLFLLHLIYQRRTLQLETNQLEAYRQNGTQLG